MKNIKCKFVVADKGYDSKSNRYFVLRDMKAYPHIPYRKISGINYERAGVPLIFDEKIYHQRSKVETVFSVIKRKYGCFVLSKSFETQKKEILIRMIAYNIDRKLILSLVIIGIHQSPNYKVLNLKNKSKLIKKEQLKSLLFSKFLKIQKQEITKFNLMTGELNRCR